MASDPKGAATGPVRGAVVDALSHAVVDILTTNASGAIVRQAPTSTYGVLSQPTDPPAIVLSSNRQTIAFFAERDANGLPQQQVRTIRFADGQQSIQPILGAERLHNVTSATYRAEDDAYYFLDETDRDPLHETDRDPDRFGNHSVRLMRMRRGFVLEKIAEWHGSPRFDHHALVAGYNYTLVVSSWSPGRHGVCVLDVGLHDVRVMETQFGSGAITVPAFKNLDGTTYVYRQADQSQAAVRLAPQDPAERPDTSDVGRCF